MHCIMISRSLLFVLCFFRLIEFNGVLSSEVVDLNRLNSLCFHGQSLQPFVWNTFIIVSSIVGCPDKDGIRALCWKVRYNCNDYLNME